MNNFALNQEFFWFKKVKLIRQKRDKKKDLKKKSGLCVQILKTLNSIH